MSQLNSTDIFSYCKTVLDACSAVGNCENVDSQCKTAVMEDRLDMDSTIFVAFVGFSILVYDHIITFNDEIKHIWKKPKGTLGCLFLLNRYLTPLSFIVNLYAYQRPNWPDSRFVRYEGFMNALGINIASYMMLIRIQALYNRNKFVVGFVATILAVEFGVNMGLLFSASSVPHLIPHASCSMVFTVKDKVLSSGSAWLPLLYDTVIFILLTYRTVGATIVNKTALKSPILEALWAEGLMYYSVIFTVTLILTVMISVAAKGVQNICAQLEFLLTVAMMSRITLDLKIRTGEKGSRLHLFLGRPGALSGIMDTTKGSEVVFRPPLIHDANTTQFSTVISSPEGTLTKSGASVRWEGDSTSISDTTSHQQAQRGNTVENEWIEMASVLPRIDEEC